MKLSAKTRYASRILLDLARHDNSEPIPATRLSQNTGVSVQFIEQILKPLKQAGLTKSTRGASGGHFLAKKPSEITLADVLVLMEGGIHLTLCSSEDRAICDSKEHCATRSAWIKVSACLHNELKNMTLQDLLDEYNVVNTDTGASERAPICSLRTVPKSAQSGKSPVSPEPERSGAAKN